MFLFALAFSSEIYIPNMIISQEGVVKKGLFSVSLIVRVDPPPLRSALSVKEEVILIQLQESPFLLTACCCGIAEA